MLPRLLTASALLLAPCLLTGCEDDTEPSVGGVPPAGPVDAEGGSGVMMDGDMDDERPSDELEENDGDAQM